MVIEAIKNFKEQINEMINLNLQKTVVHYDTELTIRLTKADMFNEHILLPRAELNDNIYNMVDQFVERNHGQVESLMIFCEPISEALQNTFREVYRDHYEEAYLKMGLYLRRRYLRVILLMSTMLLSFAMRSIGSSVLQDSFLWDVITNIGIFCLWETGYTHLGRMEAREKRRLIACARDLKIEFECFDLGLDDDDEDEEE